MICWLRDSRAYGVLTLAARKWDETAVPGGELIRRWRDYIALSADDRVQFVTAPGRRRSGSSGKQLRDWSGLRVFLASILIDLVLASLAHA